MNIGDIILFKIYIIETNMTYRRIGKVQNIHHHKYNSQDILWYKVKAFEYFGDKFLWDVRETNVIKNFSNMSYEEFEKEYPEWKI